MERAHLEKKSVNATDHAMLSKAHLTVLQQSVLLAPYMEEHMQIMRSIYPLKSETWMQIYMHVNFKLIKIITVKPYI